MTKSIEKKAVYIQSLEACDIHSHMVRGKAITPDYIGMIPFSLELIKLKKEGLKVKTVKTSKKETSDDLINVKFDQKVSSGKTLIKKIKEKIERLKAEVENEKNEEKAIKKNEYITKLTDYINVVEQEMDSNPKGGKWKEVSAANLRKQLYKDGFIITHADKETGEILSQVKYKVYKRSSAKSRTGQCLFIREDLKEEMIKWSKMDLPFSKTEEMDMASLLAYESLVGSSLEGILKINPKNILIVDDVDSNFPENASVVKINEATKSLMINEEEVTVSNSLFDGEGLLDADYFPEGKAMMLLRNHMFKSAVFNTNIQTFLKDYCPKDKEFDKWKIKNMFGEKMFAKDIHLIITPSSLKALKFSHVFDGEEKTMWSYWKKLVKSEGSVFGVCKSEKKSKRGYDDEGNILQQTSYQMINSLPVTSEDISDLVEFEINYINRLKNDDNFFIEHLKKEVSDQNSNELFVALYDVNKEIVGTKVFRDYRKKAIHKYVNHVRGGKLKLQGDYVVLFGNGVEFLKHAIGKYDETDLALKENEIYTTLHKFDKDLVSFRNPHTSQANILKIRNIKNESIEKYFNLTDNIVCVNAVKFPIQDILSGCDYDSDTMVLFDSKTLSKAADASKGYKVCVNKIKSDPNRYLLNEESMYQIDLALSESQRNIGRVVNIGQLCMSRYWDLKANGGSENELNKLNDLVGIMTVLSGVAIDMAKKMYAIDIKKEIEAVEKDLELKQDEDGKYVKPFFWKYVENRKNQKKDDKKKNIEKMKPTYYDTPMDLLIKEIKIERAEKVDDVDLLSLIEVRELKDANRKQRKEIIDYVTNMTAKIASVKTNIIEEKEQYNKIDDIVKYYNFFVEKKTVKSDTMYLILKHMVDTDFSHKVKLMNILYQTHKQVFLNAFKNSTKMVEKLTA